MEKNTIHFEEMKLVMWILNKGYVEMKSSYKHYKSIFVFMKMTFYLDPHVVNIQFIKMVWYC